MRKLRVKDLKLSYEVMEPILNPSALTSEAIFFNQYIILPPKRLVFLSFSEIGEQET